MGFRPQKSECKGSGLEKLLSVAHFQETKAVCRKHAHFQVTMHTYRRQTLPAESMDAGKTKLKERFASFVRMKDSNCATKSFHKSKNEKPLMIDFESPNKSPSGVRAFGYKRLSCYKK
jgi:hypothetical protein